MAVSQELKQREEAKRERAFDPVERWRLIQETITWAEANMKPEFRRNRPRVRPSLAPAKRK
jgi:hypothetical protein